MKMSAFAASASIWGQSLYERTSQASGPWLECVLGYGDGVNCLCLGLNKKVLNDNEVSK